MSWVDSIANAVIGAVVSKVFSKKKTEDDDDYNNNGTPSNNGSSSSYDYRYSSSHNTHSQGHNYNSHNTRSQDYNYSPHNSQAQNYYPPSPNPSNNYNNYSSHNTQPQNYYHPPSPYPSNYNNYGSPYNAQPQNYYYPPTPIPSSSSKKKYSQNGDIDYTRSKGFFGRKKKKKGYEEKGRVTRSYADWNGDGVVEESEYRMRSYGGDRDVPFSPSHWGQNQTDMTRYNY